MEPQWKKEGEMSFRGSRVLVEADGIENGNNMVLLQKGLNGTITKEPSSNLPGLISLPTPYKPCPETISSLHTSLYATLCEVADPEGRDVIVMPETLTFVEREVLKSINKAGATINEANDGRISVEKSKDSSASSAPPSGGTHPFSLKSISKVRLTRSKGTSKS